MKNGIDLDHIIKEAISKFYKKNEKYPPKDIDPALNQIIRTAQKNEKPIIINIYLSK